MVQSAAQFLVTDVVVLGILLIALIAFAMEMGLRALQRKLVRVARPGTLTNLMWIPCRSGPARDGGVSFTTALTVSLQSRAGSLLQKLEPRIRRERP